MSVSRRRFLKSAAVVSAALVLKPVTFVSAKDAPWSNTTANNEIRFQSYTREMFEPYVGDTFRVRVGKQVVDLKLEAVTDVKSASGVTTGKIARTDCFAVRFNAAKPLSARGTVRTLNHSELGDFDLFMVQSKKGTRFLHTAIVNHLV